MTEEQRRFNLAFDELVQRSPVTACEFSTPGLIAMIAGLQVVLRHPGLPLTIRNTLRSIVDKLLNYIHRQSPTLADLLRRGDNPAFDVQC